VIKILGTMLVVTLATFGQPATKPNFSGEWTMNTAKSNFGAVPPPTSITRSITHAEPALTIVEVQESPMGTQSATRKYVTDGSPSSFESMGATVASSAKWDTDALLVVSTVDAVGLTFHDRMTLSADGKMLTSEVRIASPQGDVEVTVVFEKK
jgi:hypothetical protein